MSALYNWNGGKISKLPHENKCCGHSWTHNICFHGEIRKVSLFFRCKEEPYLELSMMSSNTSHQAIRTVKKTLTKNFNINFFQLCDLDLKVTHVDRDGIAKILIVLGFNDTSTLEGHFVSSPREREKRDRRESRGDEREGQGRKRNRNKSEETEEIKTFPLYPYPLQG